MSTIGRCGIKRNHPHSGHLYIHTLTLVHINLLFTIYTIICTSNHEPTQNWPHESYTHGYLM